MTDAVIYVPAALHVVKSAMQIATYSTQCLDLCGQRDYDVTGLVTTDWAAVLAVLNARAAQVVVAARPDHVNNELRIEFADSISLRASDRHRNASPIQRRPRRV